MIALCKIESVGALISYRRLRWLGHAARMSNARLPKQMLFGMLAPAQDRIARPAAGRPTKAWSDYVREDLGHLRLAYDVIPVLV